jgi:hypothetical protein
MLIIARLQFGPISMTVASMAVLSLGLSILDLPREMRPFSLLFSRMTIVAATYVRARYLCRICKR